MRLEFPTSWLLMFAAAAVAVVAAAVMVPASAAETTATTTAATSSTTSKLRWQHEQHLHQVEWQRNDENVGDMQHPDTAHFHFIEHQRVEEYHRRGYRWPNPRYVPDTEGWRELFEERFAKIREMDDSGDRYQGWVTAVSPAYVVPNFTEHGFGLARCPPDLLEEMDHAIREGMATARIENTPKLIDAPRKPLFVDRKDLANRVMDELRVYAETWSGVELVPYRAYGFRLYRNESSLMMHVDKTQTHIISFILHIGSSDDAEPWPIYIEDFHGNSHAVVLAPGDILFYESSKAFHGRPEKFHGSWYCSLFVHYYPKYDWYDINHALEAHYAVPPSWDEKSTQHVVPHEKRLEMVGASFREPGCPNDYCRSETALRWSGPGLDGYWIAPTGEHVPFNPEENAFDSEEEEL